MSDIRAYPAYTTVARVKLELPRFDPDELTDERIEQFIDTQANEMDGRLVRLYRVPAPRLAQDGTPEPDTAKPGWYPTQLERLNRLWAADDCMSILRDIRRDEQSVKTKFKEEADDLIDRIEKGETILHYPFLHPDGRPYFLPLAEGSPIYGKHPLSATSRVTYVYPDRVSEAYDPTAPSTLLAPALRRGGY